MSNIIFNASAPTIIGKRDNNTIAFDVIENPVIAGESRSAQTHYDVNFDVVTPSSAENNAILSPTNLGISTQAYTISSDETVATVDSDLNVEWQSDGDVEIYVGAYGWGEKKFSRTMSSTATDPIADNTSFASGSLAAHVKTNVDALISGLSPSSTTQKFWASNNADTASPSATINSNNFAASLDFSAMSVMQSSQADERYPIALVTNRHGIVAEHVKPSIGATVIFKRTDGTYQTAIVDDVTDVTRTLSDATSIATPDLAVVYFDRAITGCAIFKTMPAGFAETYARSMVDHNHASGVDVAGGMPVLRKAMHDLDGNWESYLQINRITRCYYLADESIPYNTVTGSITNSSKFREQTVFATTWDWGITAIPGDSGSPSFAVVDDGGGSELILICTQHQTGVSEDISYWTDDINVIMDTQASAAEGTYTLTHPDLSGFTDYSA